MFDLEGPMQSDLAELKQARNYIAVLAKRTNESRVHDDLRSIDAAISRAEERGRAPQFRRAFAMPSAETFTIKPIAEFVRGYMLLSKISVDPFARNQKLATFRNDLDPATDAEFHHDAERFLEIVRQHGVVCDLALFDPPYSPRQVSEHYRAAGVECGRKETQTSALYSRVRRALNPIVAPGGIVLSFGWHSNGMGPEYELQEVLLIAHGSAHNDTICIAERKVTHAV